ncbi:hypothetical protein AX14_006515 [Amanita brunnescens Koide BX004]|nr:hypothetical protein AX14_006515 [Amanita brunnescens Koide BX004]
MDSSDIHTLTISLFVGNIINLYLYGALTVQLYLYYTFFPKDSRIFKGVIYAVFLIETIHTILLIYDLGLLLFHRIHFPRMTRIVVPVCGGTAAFLTQAIYAYRIRIITKRKRVSGFITTVYRFGEWLSNKLIVHIGYCVTTYCHHGIDSVTPC